MLSKSPFFCLAVLVILLVSSCELLGPGEAGSADLRKLTTDEQQVVQSQNGFGWKLFREVNSKSKDENVFISPLSVSMALSMTLNGARGKTREEMEKVLEVSGLTSEQINQSYKSLIELLTGLDPKVETRLAQSIWYREGFPVREEFIDANKNYFDAKVEALNFNQPKALDIINGWVEEKTNGKIKKLIKELKPSDVMALLNAIYFKGDWKYAFNEENTENKKFTLAGGSAVEVPFMRRTADLAYFKNDQMQMVDLPYGDSLFTMTVLLPQEGQTANGLIEQLDQEAWKRWTGQLKVEEVALEMPKFELRYQQELAGALQAMGMKQAFTEAADLSGISDGGNDLYISRILHKAFVEVNEEGTEAAAATGVMVGIVSVIDQPLKLRINRPFVFIIREQHSGTVLFAGKVINPAE